MQFEWDEAKNQRNAIKHGIRFEDAIKLFSQFTLDTIDDRVEYGEERIISIGLLDTKIILTIRLLAKVIMPSAKMYCSDIVVAFSRHKMAEKCILQRGRMTFARGLLSILIEMELAESFLPDMQIEKSGKVMKKRYDRPLTTEELAVMPDSEIDYSDIPPLDDYLLSKAVLTPPRIKPNVNLHLSEDVLEFFKAENPQNYTFKMAAILKAYVDAQAPQ